MKNGISILQVILFTILFGITHTTFAQDAHWSQFASTPLRLSPAMAGVFDGDWRVGVNYREQWASVIGPNPYRSIHASGEARFFGFGQDYFTVGLNLMNDIAGTGGYTTNEGHLSLSYLKQMAGNRRYGSAHYLVVGAQGGLGQRSVNWDDLTYSAQFNGDVFDPNLPTNELTGVSSLLYPDINAGLMWYGVFDERKSIYAGVGAHHLNKPSISFTDGSSNDFLHMKISAYLGGEYPLSDRLSVMPSVLSMFQGPSMEVTAGANIRYMWDDYGDFALRVGAWGRMVSKDRSFGTDALSVLVGMEYERIVLGISYDINTSTLVAASNRRGAFEVSMYYTHPGKTKGDVKCPKF